MELTQLNAVSTDSNCVFRSEQTGVKGSGDDRILRHFQSDPKAKFILTAFGDILTANQAAQDVLQSQILHRDPSGKLSFGSKDADTRAKQIFADMRLNRTSCERLIKRQSDERWAVLEFTAHNFDDEKEVLLTVSQPRRCSDSALNALSKAFQFTITEAEVVRHMARAKCPKEISIEMDISTNTVRAHLRSIYAKTGMRGYNRSLRLILELIL